MSAKRLTKKERKAKIKEVSLDTKIKGPERVESLHDCDIYYDGKHFYSQGKIPNGRLP